MRRSRRLDPFLRPFLCLLFVALLGSASGRLHAASKPPPADQLLRISVLDIGQGDSIVIQAPNGKTVLIDAGPGGGQQLLLNQLGRLGVQTIDLAVATHPHEDHIGGFPAVLEKFTVKNFTDPGTTHTTVIYQTVMTKLKEKKVAVRVATRGQKYKLDEQIYLEVLSPRKELIKGSDSDLNNNSAVVRLSYQDFSMVFTGDAEADAEKHMIEDGLPPTTVLKVGHHGSRSSTIAGFVDKLKPQAAVLSCEVGNDYGHPHQKTLDTLGKRSVPLYRTDQDGQVRFLTDGRQFWVMTFSRSSLTKPPLTGDPEPTRTEGPTPVRADAQARSTGETSNATPAPRSAAPAPSAEPEESAPAKSSPPATAGEYMASQKSKVFHKVGCSAAKKINEANRVFYATREEAVAAGKEPAKDCKP